MGRAALLILTLLLGITAVGQVRVGTLLVKANETYVLENSDIIVADTLIMMDSARLILNKLKRENYIRAQVAIFGDHVLIDGKGLNGKTGRHGQPGGTPFGPCADGSAGRNGGKGLDGTPGTNLFLYLEEVKLKGKLTIDLSGGNGGNGGDGGNGGSGSPGTVHCNGGNGGKGGNAGAGGNGADGGSLTISSDKSLALRSLIGSQIKVYTHGGLPGLAGRVGYQGAAGLGPSRKNGKHGAPGLLAPESLAGRSGAINIETN